MKIFDERSISSAKQQFPSIVREAAKGYEIIASNFKSTRPDKVSIISTELFEEVLNNAYKFHPLIERDTEGKGFTVSLDELLIHGDGDTLYNALQDLAENLYDYTSDYLSRIDFFMQINNRRSHYPYLRRIAGCKDIEQVMEVIAECHTDLQQVISKA
jgi:hypothetical protein